MVPFSPDVLRYGVKPRFGIERIHALPRLLCSEEALMPLVGFHAQQGRQGIGPRGATKRQGERPPGPLCPDTLATKIVQWHVRHLEAGCNASLRALAPAGVLRAKVTGILDATALATTHRDVGCGPGIRRRQLLDKPGKAPEIAVSGSGWKLLGLRDASTKIPLAVKVIKMHAPETRWRRALVTQARSHLASAAAHSGL
jgi:hypothetical protein